MDTVKQYWNEVEEFYKRITPKNGSHRYIVLCVRKAYGAGAEDEDTLSLCVNGIDCCSARRFLHFHAQNLLHLLPILCCRYLQHEEHLTP